MATNRVTCPACKGAKKVMGMGAITHNDCTTCDGEGYLIPQSAAKVIVDAHIQTQATDSAEEGKVTESGAVPSGSGKGKPKGRKAVKETESVPQIEN